MTESNGTNGRQSNGRFANGNPGGPGNPHVRRLAEYQRAVQRAVTPEDIEAIFKKLCELAKAGDLQAAKLVIDRTTGKFEDAELAERVAALEAEHTRKVRV